MSSNEPRDNKPDKPIMSSSSFREIIHDSYNSGQRFCFILGAGASKESGIKTGAELIREWREYLRKRDQSDLEWRAKITGTPIKDLKRLLGKDYTICSRDYFTFYELRYPCDPVIAYNDIQKLMEGIQPSIGYYALAVLLERTKNKLVITTNFDTLVEDAVVLYRGKHALVAGHESLAPFIGSTENKSRPIVAKIHGDLFLHPKNRRKEMESLESAWKNALSAALTRYIPIIIGYAGGDHTLMDLLKDMKEDLHAVYWCTMEKDAAEVDPEIRDFINSIDYGHLVSIQGFDTVMMELLDSLLCEEEYDSPYAKMTTTYNKRTDGFVKQLDEMVSVSCAGQMIGRIKNTLRELNDNQQARSYNTTTMSLDTFEKLSKPQIINRQNATEPHDDEPCNDCLKAFRCHVKGLRLYYNEHELHEALNVFKKALKPNSASVSYLVSLGMVQFDTGEFEDALGSWYEAYDKGTELRDASALTYLYYTFLQYALKTINEEDTICFDRMVGRVIDFENRPRVKNTSSEDYLAIARAYFELGEHARKRDRFEAAEKLLLEAVKCYKELSQEFKTDEFQREYSMALDGLAGHYSYMDEVDEAVALWQRCLSIDEQLKDELGTPESKRQLSNTLKNLGAAVYKKGYLGGAHELWERSLGIDEELLSNARQSEMNQNQRELAISKYYLGSLAYENGDYEAEKQMLGQAERILETLVQEQVSDDEYYQWDLSVVKERIGDIQATRKDYNKANERWKKCKELLDAGTDQSSDAKRDQSYIIGRLADYDRHNGDCIAARNGWRECLKIDEELYKIADIPRAKRDLAITYYALAMLSADEDSVYTPNELWTKSQETWPQIIDEFGSPFEQREANSFVSLRRTSGFES